MFVEVFPSASLWLPSLYRPAAITLKEARPGSWSVPVVRVRALLAGATSLVLLPSSTMAHLAKVSNSLFHRFNSRV